MEYRRRTSRIIDGVRDTFRLVDTMGRGETNAHPLIHRQFAGLQHRRPDVVEFRNQKSPRRIEPRLRERNFGLYHGILFKDRFCEPWTLIYAQFL